MSSIKFNVSDGRYTQNVFLTLNDSITWFQHNFKIGTVFTTVGDFTPIKCEIKVKISKLPTISTKNMRPGAVVLNTNLNDGSFVIYRTEQSPGRMFGAFEGDNLTSIEKMIVDGSTKLTFTVI